MVVFRQLSAWSLLRLVAAVVIAAFVFTNIASAGQGATGSASGSVEKAKGKTGEAASPQAKKKGTEETKPQTVPGKKKGKTPPAPVVKKKKFPWLIVGVVVVVGAAVAIYFLTRKTGPDKGKIAVSSTPSGAKVYLDGTDTGQVTLCTLADVTAGDHTVKLVLEGYKDDTQTVTVKKDQTATVSATLTRHTITVTSPGSGASWTKGTEQEIRWTVDTSAVTSRLKSKKSGIDLERAEGVSEPEALVLTNVNLDLYKGEAFVTAIIANTPNDGLEKWVVTTAVMAGTNYKVRVSCATDASIYGESAAFAIADPTGSIAVASNPAGAKIYLDDTDTTQVTPYTLSAIVLGSHTLKLTKDGYKDYARTVTVAAGATVSVSADLTKHAITVMDPSSGSSKTRGTECEIRWATDSSVSDPEKGFAIAQVTIDLYKGGTKALTIAANTPNDGLERWTVPADQTLGTDYKVRLSCSTDATIYGESGTFAIASQYGTIAVSSNPAGAKVFLDGTDTTQVTPCTLSSLSVGSHTIKLAKDGYRDYTQTVMATAGQTFTIAADLTKHVITVVDPASGSSILRGTEIEIRWTTDSSTADSEKSYTIAQVTIDLYQGGAKAQTIAANTPNDGTERWAVPADQALGTDYKLRVSCATDATISGESGTFTIMNQSGAIAVTSTPSSAKVYLDAVDSGQRTPCTLNTVAPGTHTLKVELENYGKWEGLVAVTAAQTTNADVRLTGYSYEFVAAWGRGGAGNGEFSGPIGIAVLPSGDFFVADSGNNRIQKFSSSGTYLKQWGSLGNGDGDFNRPWGLALDSSGNLYVVDRGNDRIQKFSSAGTFLGKWGQTGNAGGDFDSPCGIAVDSVGNVYVSEVVNSRIQKFSPAGNYVMQWGSRGSDDTQFGGPWGVAVDAEGNVYVTDAANSRIQKFTSGGTFLMKWRPPGGILNDPEGIAVSPSGYVFVTNYSLHNVTKWTLTGSLVAQWGSPGAENGQFARPRGIGVDSSGNVYVADTLNNRIQKFRMVTSAPSVKITYSPLIK